MQSMKRFEAKYIPEPMSGCWLWSASADRQGYGYIGVRGKTRKAHRVAYEMRHGPIPEGMVVCHRCDTPACVNPGHLFLGTIEDNRNDSITKKRHAHGARTNTAKLSEGDVVAIRRRMAAGEMGAALAREYGVDKSAIYQIRDSRTWRHLS